jgi:hypothetical protein
VALTGSMILHDGLSNAKCSTRRAKGNDADGKTAVQGPASTEPGQRMGDGSITEPETYYVGAG